MIRTFFTSELVHQLIVGFAVAFVVAVRLNGGIALTFDSWIYWESALSMLNGLGYTEIDGSPVTAWPPLYSWLLSLWGRCFGLHLESVINFSIYLSFFCGVIWTRFVYLHVSRERAGIRFLGGTFLIFYLPSLYGAFLSEVLWFPIFGALLLVLSRSDRPRADIFHLFQVTALLCLCLLTRNQTIVIIPAIFLMLWLQYEGKKKIYCSLSIFLAILVWLLSRSLLDQFGGHTINFMPKELLNQFVSLLGISGNLFAISTLQLDIMVFILVAVFCAVSLFAYRKFFSPLAFEQDSLNSEQKIIFSLVVIALGFWFGSYVIAVLLGVPAAQPRWYQVAVIALVLAFLFSICSNQRGRLFLGLSIVLFSVIYVSSAYRALYFFHQKVNMEPSIQAEFQISKEWVDQQVRGVDDALSDGLSAEEVFIEKGYSVNTYRRWKGLALVYVED